MINILKERGTAIRNLKFEAAQKCEDRINALKSNEVSYDQFTKPVAAFITFENADAQFRALKYKPAKARKSKEPRGYFMDEPLVLTQATEPTNIIWENRQFTKKQRAKKACCSLAIILVLLLISFGIILFFKLFNMRIQSKYPNVSCDDIGVQYEDKL